MGKTGGVILAAGASSRMGRFKPMLPVGKTTFIKKTIAAMQKAGVDPVVVVTGYRAAKLQEHIKNTGVICVCNERFYETQMLDSVKLGIEKLLGTCDKILLTPVDVFAASDATYQKMKELDAGFARPVFGGRSGHPVLIGKQLFPAILAYQGERGLRGAIESSGETILNCPVDDPAVTMDADTPEDYRKLIAYSEGDTRGHQKVRPEMELRFATDEILCDEQFLQLMDLVRATGSLQKASNAMHMSYTKAWKIIKFVEKRTSTRLIDRMVGGEDGGRSELTEAGSEFVWRYQRMREELDWSAEHIFEKYFGDFYL
ncbi:MAG: NTP transferase domain-containing protein [Lachnospiraceae bacterium]|nr:NTP transferase domain-containing protein [Lachnospiraceae bacterium]